MRLWAGSGKRLPRRAGQVADVQQIQDPRVLVREEIEVQESRGRERTPVVHHRDRVAVDRARTEPGGQGRSRRIRPRDEERRQLAVTLRLMIGVGPGAVDGQRSQDEVEDERSEDAGTDESRRIAPGLPGNRREDEDQDEQEEHVLIGEDRHRVHEDAVGAPEQQQVHRRSYRGDERHHPRQRRRSPVCSRPRSSAWAPRPARMAIAKLKRTRIRAGIRKSATPGTRSNATR